MTYICQSWPENLHRDTDSTIWLDDALSDGNCEEWSRTATTIVDEDGDELEPDESAPIDVTCRIHGSSPITEPNIVDIGNSLEAQGWWICWDCDIAYGSETLYDNHREDDHWEEDEAEDENAGDVHLTPRASNHGLIHHNWSIRATAEAVTIQVGS